MDQQEAHEVLRDFESRHDLLAFEVDGWCVWPLFRWLVAFALSQKETAFSPSEGWPHRQRVTLGVRDVIRLQTLSPSRLLVVVNASNRSERELGRFKDIYFDDFLRDATTFVKLEHPNTKAFRHAGKAALIPSDLTSTPFTALSSVLTRSGRPRGFDRMGSELSSIMQAEGLEGFDPPRITDALRHFYWQKKLFGRLLRRLSPEYLLLVNPYGDHPIVAAAKEHGVEVIEFQHGACNRHHPGYSWASTAAVRKKKMPLPDRIFLYGEHWRNELRANGFWLDELRVVGSPRIDYYRRHRQEKFDVPTLTVTMQAVDVERVLEFLREFLRLATMRSEVRLMIKLHPTEMAASNYQAVLGDDPRVQVITSVEEPTTFELIARSRFHASISSTCHFESLALGTPTIILPFTTHDRVLHLHDDESVFLARTPEELIRVFFEPPKVVPESLGAYYFAPGAVQNMKRELSL